jgi:hypothetical protein
MFPRKRSPERRRRTPRRREVDAVHPVAETRQGGVIPDLLVTAHDGRNRRELTPPRRPQDGETPLPLLLDKASRLPRELVDLSRRRESFDTYSVEPSMHGGFTTFATRSAITWISDTGPMTSPLLQMNEDRPKLIG